MIVINIDWVVFLLTVIAETPCSLLTSWSRNSSLSTHNPHYSHVIELKIIYWFSSGSFLLKHKRWHIYQAQFCLWYYIINVTIQVHQKMWIMQSVSYVWLSWSLSLLQSIRSRGQAHCPELITVLSGSWRTDAVTGNLPLTHVTRLSCTDSTRGLSWG